MTEPFPEWQMPSSWRTFWHRLWHPVPVQTESAPASKAQRQLPITPQTTTQSKLMPPSTTGPSWAAVQHQVRQWPSGMAITSDLLAEVFHVGRGKAWRWLERLERAGLVYATEDPPNAQGIRRKRRWVR